MTLLFKCDHTDPGPWLAALAEQLPGREIRVFPEVGAAEDIAYALVYEPPPGLLASLPADRAEDALARLRETVHPEAAIIGAITGPLADDGPLVSLAP